MKNHSGLEFQHNLEIDSVLQAVENFGLEPTGHCIQLNSLENRVFYLSLEEQGKSENLPHSVVVKFYRPNRWTRAQIQEEHDFLKELQSFEIPAIAPLAHRSTGETIQEQNGMFYTVWPNQKGRLVEELSEAQLPVLGRLLARIHNIGESHSANHRIKLNIHEYGLPALHFLFQKEWIPKSLVQRYETTAKSIFQQFEDHSKNVSFHRIHGDCHKGNLIETDSSFCFIDFDDFVTGPAIQDFWMLLPFGDSRAEAERELFLDGYREFREFHDSWWNLVEPLRGMRYIHYSAWIAKRWLDPAFQDSFPHFGTEEYWESETRDLEKLAKGIPLAEDSDSKIAIQANPNKEEELTNKDFFWDLED